jgi:hypothetical protein
VSALLVSIKSESCRAALDEWLAAHRCPEADVIDAKRSKT